MIPDAPAEILTKAAKEAIDLDPADWEDLTGIEGITTRHYRHRRTGKDERPNIALMFVNDGPPGEDVPQISYSEKLRSLELTLVAEIDLPPEESGEDDTGCLLLHRMLDAALLQLRDPARGFYMLVWEIVDGLKELDENSQPDMARMTRTFSVLYRVSSDDETVLLSGG